MEKRLDQCADRQNLIELILGLPPMSTQNEKGGVMNATRRVQVR
jgi:hypothetical protein